MQAAGSPRGNVARWSRGMHGATRQPWGRGALQHPSNLGLLERRVADSKLNSLEPLEPLRLYDTAFLADLAGVSTQSIRKVTGGFRAMPLIPRVTRLGAATVRFAGRDILAWLDDPQANSEQARQARGRQQEQATAAPAPTLKRRPGRPTNKERAARAGGAL